MISTQWVKEYSSPKTKPQFTMYGTSLHSTYSPLSSSVKSSFVQCVFTAIRQEDNSIKTFSHEYTIIMAAQSGMGASLVAQQ